MHTKSAAFNLVMLKKVWSLGYWNEKNPTTRVEEWLGQSMKVNIRW